METRALIVELDFFAHMVKMVVDKYPERFEFLRFDLSDIINNWCVEAIFEDLTNRLDVIHNVDSFIEYLNGYGVVSRYAYDTFLEQEDEDEDGDLEVRTVKLSSDGQTGLVFFEAC
jgi:hypothetical protein